MLMLNASLYIIKQLANFYTKKKKNLQTSKTQSFSHFRMQKLQNKKKTFSEISKNRVGILLYSKKLFSDFQNQGQSGEGKQTIFFLA